MKICTTPAFEIVFNSLTYADLIAMQNRKAVLENATKTYRPIIVVSETIEIEMHRLRRKAHNEKD